MFVQALADYADRYLEGELQNEFWEIKPVPFLLEIDAHGQFLGRITREKEERRGKKLVKVPEELGVPKSPILRNSGIYPLLAVDDIKYVLGSGPWTKPGQEQNNQERFEAFVALLSKAAAATGDTALRACVKFYERSEEVEKARREFSSAKAGTLVGLSVGGPVVGRQAVKDFWREHYRAASDARVAGTDLAECLISGRVGPIAPTHDKVKGLSGLGGQPAGVSLMSFDKSAFRSYGWDQCANSPVSLDRANAYVLALNDLLKPGGRHRRDVAGVAYVFWTRRDADLIFDWLYQPNPAQVSQLLAMRPDGVEDIDPNMFYMAGLGANGGRLLVRYWVAQRLSNIQRNLANWFRAIAIINPFTGERAEYPKLWQLLGAIHREGEPPADLGLALIRRALEGEAQPLGKQILNAVLTRLRREKDRRLDAVRYGLLRICTNDSTREQGAQMSEQLDDGIDQPAYLCGRLLAVHESLQYTTYRSADESKVNVSVADRYYSLASVSPQVALPKVLDLGRKHLAKLGRSEKSGLRFVLEKQIAELCDRIKDPRTGAFPKVMSLADQGRFALGYYHQKAHDLNRKKATSDQLSAEEKKELSND